MSKSFWLEVTDRKDLGADLHAPQTNETGKPFWSYSLINALSSGDTVFHYHKPRSAIVGVSRVDGNVREEEVQWAARGTSARNAKITPHMRPGWVRGLREFTQLDTLVTLADVRREAAALQELTARLKAEQKGAIFFPFALSHKRPPRPSQGYLFKVPDEFVRLFPSLAEAAGVSKEVVYAIGAGTSTPVAKRAVREPRPTTYQPSPLGRPYQAADEAASRTEINLFPVDPSVVERGLKGHAITQNALAAELRARGLEPRSPAAGEPEFDLGWEHAGRRVVAEVKSLTNQNEERQLRLGLGQLIHYRAMLAKPTAGVDGVLVVERPPRDLRWLSVCESVGVRLVWPAVFGSLWGPTS
ncbi:MAG TPA: hypothetical protein VFE05_09300 [Longimicrobiaceae bacterium]|jgi:hypothetical protein|nr:hypothetical protein [Longimicrobiaceae bacterium]